MKIRITGNGHDFGVNLPTRLLFSKPILGILLKSAGGSSIAGRISSRTAGILAQELNRIQKQHGSWTLVEVHSADGEEVKIVL